MKPYLQPIEGQQALEALSFLHRKIAQPSLSGTYRLLPFPIMCHEGLERYLSQLEYRLRHV